MRRTRRDTLRVAAVLAQAYGRNMEGGLADDALSAHVQQASGMVAEQLGCPVEEALLRLRIRATAQHKTLEEMALDVLDGEIRFDE